MSTGRTVREHAVYENHFDNCVSSPSLHHQIHIVAAAEVDITDDHLALSSGQPLQTGHRERSYSASGRRCASPGRASSVAQFLSPDYGSGRPAASGGGAARRRATRRRDGRPDGDRDGGATTTIRRCSSATLAASDGRTASSSSFGSGLHLGSSVTFFNTFGRPPAIETSMMTAAEHHELFTDNSNGPRRSCSITLAHPSHSVLPTSDQPPQQSQQSAAATNEYGTTSGDQPSSSLAFRRDVSGRGLFFPGRLTLAPPVITYDAVTSMPPPSSPSQRSGDWSPGCHHVQSPRSRNVLVTPRGSFLAVNQAPIEFRESMLSIGYPNFTGRLHFCALFLFLFLVCVAEGNGLS